MTDALIEQGGVNLRWGLVGETRRMQQIRWKSRDSLGQGTLPSGVSAPNAPASRWRRQSHRMAEQTSSAPQGLNSSGGKYLTVVDTEGPVIQPNPTRKHIPPQRLAADDYAIR